MKPDNLHQRLLIKWQHSGHPENLTFIVELTYLLSWFYIYIFFYI
jgi:hypothetical protein